MKAVQTDRGILLQGKLTRNLKSALQDIPDGWFTHGGEVYVADTTQNRAVLSEYITPPFLPPEDDYQFKTTPYQHQLEAWRAARDKRAFGYFMEMGTGKTKTLLDDMAYQYRKGRIDGAVLIAPNGVHRQFIEEQLPEHFPDNVPVRAEVYRSGAGIKLKRRLDRLKDKKLEELRVVGMNVESLSHRSGEKFLTDLLKSGRFMMAVDESTTIKTPGARRTRVVLKLAPKAVCRRVLSGAPITRGVEDLYTQFQFLDPQILKLKSFYAFRGRYCVTAPIPGAPDPRAKKIVGYRKVDELQEKIAPYVYRVTKDECLDLPPKVYVDRTVELHKEQQDLYNQLKRELLAELADGTIFTAPLAIVRLTRLQQIVCGHLPLDFEEGEAAGWRPLPSTGKNPRVEETRKLIEESEGPVIVWARFTADIDLLQEALKDLGCVRYDGKVTRNDRYENIRIWRRGDAKVFLAKPASGGIGLNLTGAHTVIYYSNSFDAEHRWQSEDRCHRSGTVHKVTYIDLVAPGTIDAQITKALSKKQNVATMTLNGIRRLIDE